jgi:hypothetical protein
MWWCKLSVVASSSTAGTRLSAVSAPKGRPALAAFHSITPSESASGIARRIDAERLRGRNCRLSCLPRLDRAIKFRG